MVETYPQGDAGLRRVRHVLIAVLFAATASVGVTIAVPGPRQVPPERAATGDHAARQPETAAAAAFPTVVPNDAREIAGAASLANFAPTLAGSGGVEAQVLPPLPVWVRNDVATTLWSGPDAGAEAFTDIPPRSWMRVQGPAEDGRWPVFYVGDGLLRRPGGAWVDQGEVAAADPPPPGQVKEVDALANQTGATWVQARAATPLWSGPDGKAVVLTDLPQWSYLEAEGLARGGRVLVHYAGDFATRQPGVGWVDERQVGPAPDPGEWIQNHRASHLWSGPDDKAQSFTDVPQWTKLKVVDGAPTSKTRIMVQYFGDGGTRQPGVAWIPKADIGPVTPPTPLPGLALDKTGPLLPGMEVHAFASQSDFVNEVGAAAQRSQQTTHVPASVTVAQAILESDWGRSRLARQGNNLFGIKAQPNPGPAGVVTLPTWEHLDGDDVMVQADFKAYYTLDQSLDDHARFFRGRGYRDAMAVANDPRAFAQAIQDDGYATDPDYADKLIRLMDRYNLYRFDAG